MVGVLLHCSGGHKWPMQCVADGQGCSEAEQPWFNTLPKFCSIKLLQERLRGRKGPSWAGDLVGCLLLHMQTCNLLSYHMCKCATCSQHDTDSSHIPG